MASKKQRSLYDEIKEFHKEKKKYVIVLFFFGILGLIFPIIPGLLLLGMGVALLDPKGGEELIQKIKDWVRSFFKRKI
ncbi:hypothetical protein B6D60_06495 [candidate division KSB1 bacterium 4484_87]|nr:MAG: hypothetical protein B6D60_06495 [candidate division KSB1 bacterium 4484_87]